MAGAVVAFGASDVGEIFTGTNVIRDGIFRGNQKAYDGARNSLSVASAGIVGLAACNQGLGKSYKYSRHIDSEKVYKSASAEYKYGETQAGHSIQKHAGRDPDIWGVLKGNTDSINNIASQHIADILKSDGGFEVISSGNKMFLEKYLSDGRGLRLNMDGTFKGFVVKK